MESSKKKLYLIPVLAGVRKLIPEKETTVRINGTNSSMNISSTSVDAMNMNEKFYRLFFDNANSVIAWQIKDKLNQEQLESKTWKLAKKNTSGQITISIGRVLDALGKKNEKSQKCVVKKYELKDQMMADGDYYFIELE